MLPPLPCRRFSTALTAPGLCTLVWVLSPQPHGWKVHEDKDVSVLLSLCPRTQTTTWRSAGTGTHMLSEFIPSPAAEGSTYEAGDKVPASGSLSLVGKAVTYSEKLMIQGICIGANWWHPLWISWALREGRGQSLADRQRCERTGLCRALNNS